MKNLRTYDQLIPYLTIEAKQAIENLKEAGINDRDLAMTLIENWFTDEELYVLGSEED